jgi:hypothetical protein
MRIVEHNSHGATLHLDQRELLMVMALVQEGRDSFECNGQTGRALDELFSSANIMVEEARRADLRNNMLQQTIETFVINEDDSQDNVSNA